MKKHIWPYVILFICHNKTFAQHLKSGDVDPAAIALDALEFDHFNEGAAIIKYGTNTSIIDRSGKLTKKFGEAKFELSKAYYRGNAALIRPNGIFPGVRPDSTYVYYLIKEGKTAPAAFSMTKNEKALYFFDVLEHHYYTHESGLSKLSYSVEEHAEGFAVYREKGKKGFVRLKDGKKITNPIFDYARRFSESMAVVGKKDDTTGIIKYGFIDNFGKLEIAYKYSNIPGDFHSGLAKVEPVLKDSIVYAFINKKGSLVIKHSPAEVATHGQFREFSDGFCFSDKAVMTTDGTILSIDSILKFHGIKKGVTLSSRNGTLPDALSGAKLRYVSLRDSNEVTHQPMVGWIDLTHNKKIDPVFDREPFDLYFDPVSKLAYASLTFKDKNHKVIKREGYINENGIFLIIRKTPASTTW